MKVWKCMEYLEIFRKSKRFLVWHKRYEVDEKWEKLNSCEEIMISWVGCHFLLQCIKVKSESEVAQSCPTLRNPMVCSLPGSSVHGIFQARELEWGAIAFSISAGRRYQRQLLCIYGLICSKQRLHNLTHLCFGKTTLIILKKDKSKRRNTGFEWQVRRIFTIF